MRKDQDKSLPAWLFLLDSWLSSEIGHCLCSCFICPPLCSCSKDEINILYKVFLYVKTTKAAPKSGFQQSKTFNKYPNLSCNSSITNFIKGPLCNFVSIINVFLTCYMFNFENKNKIIGTGKVKVKDYTHFRSHRWEAFICRPYLLHHEALI